MKKKKTSKIHIEPQKTLNNQRNFEQEEQSERSHDSWFQNVLQSYGDPNSMVQTWKQTHRPMK